jgi:hypothetical protein
MMQDTLSYKSNSFSFIRVIGILLALTVLFPEVGLISFSDVQPNFFILSALCILVLATKIKLSVKMSSYFTVCVLCLVLSFIVHNANITWFYVLKYSICLLTFLFCYILCSNKILVISNKLIIISIFIYLFVGLVQFKIPDFLTSLVTRGLTTADLASSGRGMMSLTGEPSHFGKVITILNILFVFKSLVDKEKGYNYVSLQWFTITLFILNCLICQSTYACFFHFICMIGIFYILNRRLAYVFMALVFFGSVSVITFLSLTFPEARIAQILNLLLTNPEMLLQQGAIVRLLNVPLTFVNLSYFGLWGSGNSSLVFSGQVDLVAGVLEYAVWNRLYGGFIEYVLKMGVLSIPLVIGYLYMMITIARIKFKISGHLRSGGAIFAGMLLMLSLQDGSPASPLMIYVVIYVFLEAKTLLGKARWHKSSFDRIN